MRSKAILTKTLIVAVLTVPPVAVHAGVRVHYSAAEGIGAEDGVMRRDPSDIIKVGNTYYVWYTKGYQPDGYNATVRYATSPDGPAWTEKGEALVRGPRASWDEQSVFTPNILIAEGRYWLFYTAVSKPFTHVGNKVTKTAIGAGPAGIQPAYQGPQVSFDRPELSPCLARSADANSPKDTEALAIIQPGKEMLRSRPRADMPGFQACAPDQQREARYAAREEIEARDCTLSRDGRSNMMTDHSRRGVNSPGPCQPKNVEFALDSRTSR